MLLTFLNKVLGDRAGCFEHFNEEIFMCDGNLHCRLKKRDDFKEDATALARVSRLDSVAIPSESVYHTSPHVAHSNWICILLVFRYNLKLNSDALRIMRMLLITHNTNTPLSLV